MDQITSHSGLSILAGCWDMISGCLRKSTLSAVGQEAATRPIHQGVASTTPTCGLASAVERLRSRRGLHNYMHHRFFMANSVPAPTCLAGLTLPSIWENFTFTEIQTALSRQPSAPTKQSHARFRRLSGEPKTGPSPGILTRGSFISQIFFTWVIRPKELSRLGPTRPA